MKYLKVLLLIAAIFMFVVACGDDDPINDLVEECSTIDDCNGTPMQYCCNPSQCKYVIGSHEILCDDLSCSAAKTTEATNYCIGL